MCVCVYTWLVLAGVPSPHALHLRELRWVQEVWVNVLERPTMLHGTEVEIDGREGVVQQEGNKMNEGIV